MTTALREKAPGVTIKQAQIIDVNNGTCTKIRIRLQMDEAGTRAGIPELIILKGGFEPHSRAMWHIHEAEVRGYRDVSSVLGLPSPACYFADYDHDRRQGIVIMEDLTKRNVTFCNALRPQTHDQVARQVSALARFHAQTWNSPEFEIGRWSWVEHELRTIRDRYFCHLLQPDIWAQYVSAPRGAAASVRFHNLKWAREAVDKLMVHGDRMPHVLLHGDAHIGNVYVDPEGNPGFYDPLHRHGPAMRDMAYHIVTALDTADRRRWEGALIQRYLDELRRNGADAPSFDTALDDYRKHLLIGYMIFIINDAHFQPESIATACVSRFSAAMIDHGTMELLDAVA